MRGIIYVLCVCAVRSQDQNAVVTYFENNNPYYEGSDLYDFKFKTSNGIERSETAKISSTADVKAVNVNGFYSFIAPNGQEFVVHYIADENGYRILSSTEQKSEGAAVLPEQTTSRPDSAGTGNTEGPPALPAPEINTLLNNLAV